MALDGIADITDKTERFRRLHTDFKTAEQIEGIRRSSVVNTGVLDLVAREIKAGMSTAEIDKLVYDYTVSHGAIPAPLNYDSKALFCLIR